MFEPPNLNLYLIKCGWLLVSCGSAYQGTKTVFCRKHIQSWNLLPLASSGSGKIHSWGAGQWQQATVPSQLRSLEGNLLVVLSFRTGTAFKSLLLPFRHHCLKIVTEALNTLLFMLLCVCFQ